MTTDPTTTGAELQRVNKHLAVLREELHRHHRPADLLRIALGVCLGIWLFLASLGVIAGAIGALMGWSVYSAANRVTEEMRRETDARSGQTPSPGAKPR